MFQFFEMRSGERGHESIWAWVNISSSIRSCTWVNLGPPSTDRATAEAVRSSSSLGEKKDKKWSLPLTTAPPWPERRHLQLERRLQPQLTAPWSSAEPSTASTTAIAAFSRCRQTFSSLAFHGDELSLNLVSSCLWFRGLAGLRGFGEGPDRGGRLHGPDAHQEGGKNLAFVPKKELQTFSRVIGDFEYSWFHSWCSVCSMPT
jgi:hypothetical protein